MDYKQSFIAQIDHSRLQVIKHYSIYQKYYLNIFNEISFNNLWTVKNEENIGFGDFNRSLFLKNLTW